LEIATSETENDYKNKEEAKAIKEEVAKSMYGDSATVSGNKITYMEGDEEKTVELSKEEF
jgi:uncharacterized protein YcfJ